MNRLGRSFFARPVLEVATDLLGRHVQHANVTVRITETEAYAGRVDPASRGARPRLVSGAGPTDQRTRGDGLAVGS